MATQKKISIFVFLFISFTLGFSLFLAANKDYFIERDPAAIPGKLMHFNNLTTEQLHNELAHKIKIKPVLNSDAPSGKSIVFSGMSSQICQSYSEIHMEFLGEGVSVGGEQTKMQMVVPCQAAQDPAEIASVILPIQEILKQEPRDAEYTFNGYAGKFVFSKVADQWPRTWVLNSVKFTFSTPQNSGANFVIASPREVQFNKIASETYQPIVLEF